MTEEVKEKKIKKLENLGKRRKEKDVLEGYGYLNLRTEEGLKNTLRILYEAYLSKPLPGDSSLNGLFYLNFMNAFFTDSHLHSHIKERFKDPETNLHFNSYLVQAETRGFVERAIIYTSFASGPRTCASFIGFRIKPDKISEVEKLLEVNDAEIK